MRGGVEHIAATEVVDAEGARASLGPGGPLGLNVGRWP
jgi:hypothetical protein